APAKGCAMPQTRLCRATAKAKSVTGIPRSNANGPRKRPKVWRTPIAAPIVSPPAMTTMMIALNNPPERFSFNAVDIIALLRRNLSRAKRDHGVGELNFIGQNCLGGSFGALRQRTARSNLAESPEL